MQFTTLLPFLTKLATESTDPSVQEIADQLRKQLKGNEQDKNPEAIDTEILHNDEGGVQEQNAEGQLLETGFKELEVEDAEEKAREEKKVGVSVQQNPTPQQQAPANLWEYLRQNYGSNKRLA